VEILHKAPSQCNVPSWNARLPCIILTRSVRMQLVDESPAWNDLYHRPSSGCKHHHEASRKTQIEQKVKDDSACRKIRCLSNWHVSSTIFRLMIKQLKLKEYAMSLLMVQVRTARKWKISNQPRFDPCPRWANDRDLAYIPGGIKKKAREDVGMKSTTWWSRTVD